MHALFRQRRLRWLGQVRRMEDDRIPQYILYGERALGRRTSGRHHLRNKHVFVRDMKAVDINHISWEDHAAECPKTRLQDREDELITAAANNRARRKEGSNFVRPKTSRYVARR